MKPFRPEFPVRNSFGPRALRHGLTVLSLVFLFRVQGSGAAEIHERAELFAGPVGAYAEEIARAPHAKPGVLRTLQVEERAGVPRAGDLVRVPLFFAQGECPSLDALQLIADDASGHENPIPFQADDVRRGPDGAGISRVHLWFVTDLAAGQKKKFVLRQTDASARPQPADPMKVTRNDEGGLVIATENGRVVFDALGGIQKISAAAGAWDFGPQAMHPHVALSIPGPNGAPSRELALASASAKCAVSWKAGALFTKVQVRIAAEEGAVLEQTFRVPQHGREIILTSALFPGTLAGAVVTENQLLASAGPASPAVAPSIRQIPAGIREALRAEHAYSVSALVDPKTGQALLAIPLVLGGGNGMWSANAEGRIVLSGHPQLQQGREGEKRTLFAYWTEVRLIPTADTTDAALWETYRRQVQPLVAVVDEPGVTVADLHSALRDLVQEMKPIGWRQEAGRARVLGDDARVTRILQRVSVAREGSVDNLINGAKAASAKLTNDGQRKLREDEKGKAYGGLDPYHVTYTQSAAAALAVLDDAPPAVSATNLAMARGVREFGGRIGDDGFPYVDCFNRTLNMQLGPVLFGLTAGKAAHDQELVHFYRDLATAPAVKAVFGRGQRPYTGAPAISADQTDYLYQSICDFWLRATELLGNENLELHPFAYSRYTDCIDVMADLYHGPGPKPKDGENAAARANFFRGQAHTHRWLGWSCSPFIRLLEDPRENCAVGLTEAVHYTRNQLGRWKNWPDLTFYVLADLLVREGLQGYRAPVLPAMPSTVNLTRRGEVTELVWAPVNGAASYRVYRATAHGGPYCWLNSPHVEVPLSELTAPRFSDAGADPGCSYVVTAVDVDGRESAWTNARPVSLAR